MRNALEIVLVTGGAGYIGTAVVSQLLSSGYRVRVLDSLLHGQKLPTSLDAHPACELIVGDVRDQAMRAEALAGVDGVVHLAALVGEAACNRDMRATTAVNLNATLALHQDAKNLGVSRFVFSSTCSNYGITTDDTLVGEEAVLEPISAYAESKVGAEKYLLRPVAGQMDIVVLRFATAYGVSQRMRFDLLVNHFSRDATRNSALEVYGPKYWRPYAHIKDIARAVDLALVREPSFPDVFNVGSSVENYQKVTIAELCAAIIPGTALGFVEGPDDPRSYRVSFEKVEQSFGFTPEFNVSDGIREVHAFLESNPDIDPFAERYVN